MGNGLFGPREQPQMDRFCLQLFTHHLNAPVVVQSLGSQAEEGEGEGSGNVSGCPKRFFREIPKRCPMGIHDKSYSLPPLDENTQILPHPLQARTTTTVSSLIHHLNGDYPEDAPGSNSLSSSYPVLLHGPRRGDTLRRSLFISRGN